MAVGGVLATVAGSLGASIAGGTAAVWLTPVVLVGLALVVASAMSRRLVSRGRRALAQPSQELELRTWPYRSIRAPVRNRLLVTFDRPGSTDRTPVAEVTASWATPGAASSPAQSARVFGALHQGAVLLAVARDGSCFLGRVVRSRS
jgi:hypothetical protein